MHKPILSEAEYTALAHRIANKYVHHNDPRYVAYTFFPGALGDVVGKIEEAVIAKFAGQKPFGCVSIYKAKTSSSFDSYRFYPYGQSFYLDNADECINLYAHPAPAQPVDELSPLDKRRVWDAIRGAYDLGYNDARNASAVSGDSAPGYKGREVEADHGNALMISLLQRKKPVDEAAVQDVIQLRQELARYKEREKTMGWNQS